jgi:nicotinamidase-related amidase
MGSSPNPEVLLVLDVQQGSTPRRGGEGTTPEMEERVAELLDAWRSSNRPVIHLKHMSTDPGSPLRP